MHARTAATIVWSLAASLALAHDTWILAPGAAAPRSTIRVEMTSGMAFPDVESLIAPDRVTRAKYRVAGQERALPAPRPTQATLRYTLAAFEEGVATIWVELAPQALRLEPKLVDEYLHEIGATDTIGRRWRARAEPKVWHEVYRKLAKTFVRVGDPPAADTSWRDAVGMPLELVPETDPTVLASGKSLTLRLLKNGQPLAGLPIAAERGLKDARKRTFQTSDAGGRATFTLDRPGAWLFAATQLREKGAEWESDFTTLTVFVAAPLPR